MNTNDALAMISAFHLDYLSCVLTIASTLLVGRRLWQGWVVAAVNSVVICLIGLRTGQWGLVPANVFCLGLYAYNLRAWRVPGSAVQPAMNEMAVQADGPTSPRSA